MGVDLLSNHLLPRDALAHFTTPSTPHMSTPDPSPDTDDAQPENPPADGNDFDDLIDEKLKDEDLEAVFSELDAAYDRLDTRVAEARCDEYDDKVETRELKSASEVFDALGDGTCVVFSDAEQAHVSLIRTDPWPEFNAVIVTGDGELEYRPTKNDIEDWFEKYPTTEVRDVRDNLHFHPEETA